MVILDTTIVAVALETLSRDLNSSLSTIQWVSSGYLLSLALVIPPSGWVTERFGSKRVWIVSLGLFGIGSALCGLAWSAGALIFFRVLQGLGGGMIMPVGMSLLTQTAGPKRVGRVMSWSGAELLADLSRARGASSTRLVALASTSTSDRCDRARAGGAVLNPGSCRADAGPGDWRGLL